MYFSGLQSRSGSGKGMAFIDCEFGGGAVVATLVNNNNAVAAAAAAAAADYYYYCSSAAAGHRPTNPRLQQSFFLCNSLLNTNTAAAAAESNNNKLSNHSLLLLQYPSFRSCEANVRSPSPAFKKRRAEQLWRHLFAIPSEWWDHRLDKANARYPDFKHKKTQDALWIENPYTPDWVIAELSAMASHTIQQSAFSWNVRLEKLVKDGQHMKAINYFRHMEAERVSMDTFTFVSVLNACAHLRTLNEGRRIHAKIIQSGCECHIFVGNGLINMYAKCGSIVEARRVFNNMVARDVVSWNAMVVGYVKCGDGLKALELFLRMRQGGVEPNTITFVGSLNACASLAALEQGRLIHEQIRQMGLESDPFLECCLIDMYTKCGSITDARKVFDNMGSHNVVPWNAMILGYALHGLGKEALRLFDQMCKAGAEINSSTFVSLLTACNHGGLVDEGEYCLESMNAVYGIEANLKHYSSLVDLLGRCGHLGGAEDMVTKMWCQPDHLVWMTLLSACNTHGNMRLGEKAAKRLLQLDPENTAAYVLLSNIYGTFGVWPYQPHSKNNENMICT